MSAIREGMTVAEFAKKYGVHPTQINTWKRAAISNMASTFSRRGDEAARTNEVEIDKLHSKIGQLVVERDFFELNRSSKAIGGWFVR